MITVGMNYKVVAGQEGAFEAAFRSVIKAMEADAGHVESHLWRDVDEPGSYLITSEWRDRAAYEAFVRSERFARVTSWGKEQVLRERPRHWIHDHGSDGPAGA
ncbi:MAG: antibiotic biosynthesis monooxygenase [Nitrospirae bacterium]|nr:MAG: antibiotic biosynthesis monooxygenase [Nitrospirota bacterium]